MEGIRDFPFVDLKLHKTKVKMLYRKVPFVGRLITDMEATALYELAYGLHSPIEHDADILEFGTFCGASSIAMAQGLEDNGNDKLIYTIDHNHWHVESAGIAAAAFKKLRLHRRVCQLIGDDVHLFEKFWRDPIKLFFQDITNRNILDTLHLSFPFIVDGGFIAVHNYDDGSVENVINPVHEFLDSMGNVITPFLIDSLICLQKELR